MPAQAGIQERPGRAMNSGDIDRYVHLVHLAAIMTITVDIALRLPGPTS